MGYAHEPNQIKKEHRFMMLFLGTLQKNLHGCFLHLHAHALIET